MQGSPPTLQKKRRQNLCISLLKSKVGHCLSIYLYLCKSNQFLVIPAIEKKNILILKNLKIKIS